MKFLVIYFHGFGSTKFSRTSKMIQDEYPDHVVFGCTYNTTDADLAIPQLDSFIKAYITIFSDRKVLLVGSSLGGFFANYFSNKYGYPCILINPCLDPHIRLEKYNTKDKIVKCKSFEKYISEDTHFEKLIVLGREDDIIPYNTFLHMFIDYRSVTVINDMKHRVSSIGEIKSALSVYL